MPKVTYIEFNGTRHEVEVSVDDNVMQGAVFNSVPGILGECGGACSCATCRCTVDPAWTARVGGPVSDIEKELLEGAEGELKPNMRLSCQINVTAELDGLVVHMPESQF